MPKIVRCDNWTEEHDKQAIEIVIAKIKNGETQLAGFEEVSKALGRSPAAIGNRWNSILRKRNGIEERIANAKRFAVSNKLQIRLMKRAEKDQDSNFQLDRIENKLDKVLQFMKLMTGEE